MAELEHEICPACGLDVNLRERRFLDHVTSRYTPFCKMSGKVAPSKRTYEESERFHYTGITS